MRWAVIIFLGAGLVGCPTASAPLELPITDGTQTVILLRAPIAGAPSASVFDVASRRPFPTGITFRPESEEDLFGLELDCPAAALGLNDGPIGLATLGRPLPLPDRLARAEVRKGMLSATWASSSTATLPALGFDLPPPDGICAPPSASGAAPLIGGPLSLAIALGDDQAFLAGEDGVFYRWSADHGTERSRLSTATPRRAAFRTESGRVWLLGDGGSFAHFDAPSETLAIDFPATEETTGARRALDGAPNGDTELFAASDRGSFERFDGALWEPVGPRGPGHDPARFGEQSAIGVAWIGRGEAVAIGVDPPHLTRWQHGRLENDALPIEASDWPTVVLRAPELGVVAATRAGRVFRLDRDRWAPLVSFDAGSDPIRAGAVYSGGLLFAGPQGTLYRAPTGYPACAPARPLIMPADRIIALEHGFLVSRAGQSPLSFLADEKRGPRLSCH